MNSFSLFLLDLNFELKIQNHHCDQKIHQDHLTTYILTCHSNTSLPYYTAILNLSLFTFPSLSASTQLEGVHFFNQVKVKVPISEHIASKTFNKFNLCYQCYVNSHGLMVGNIIIMSRIKKPYISF